VCFQFRLVFLVITLAASSPVLAQLDGLRFRHIGTEAGLSQSNVTSILQDKLGFMWFGTRDGLNRYDGYQFTVFRHTEGDTNTIANNFISSLLDDGNGGVWIGTWGGGVEHYNRRKSLCVAGRSFYQLPDERRGWQHLDLHGRPWTDLL